MRTFLAVSLAELFAPELQSWFENHQSISKVRWVPLRLIHITLHFFGTISTEQVDSASGIAAQVAGKTSPFALHLKGCGFFPDLRDPRVLWAGVGGDGGLEDLQKKLSVTIEGSGLPFEKRLFSPHATLGRMNPGFKMPDMPFDFPQTPARTVHSFELFQSVSSARGSDYRILRSFPLS